MRTPRRPRRASRQYQSLRQRADSRALPIERQIARAHGGSTCARPRLRRDVAIKVLPEAFAQDPERLRRFEQEARAASALNHPNILTVHDVGIQEATHYIVTELLDGQSLRDALRDGPLSIPQALDFGVQISRGLAAAHEQRIVHRDLKPENLFVTTDCRLKILDFV